MIKNKPEDTKGKLKYNLHLKWTIKCEVVLHGANLHMLVQQHNYSFIIVTPTDTTKV